MPRARSHQPHSGRFGSRANSITHPGPPRARDFRVRQLYRSQDAATLSILPIILGAASWHSGRLVENSPKIVGGRPCSLLS